MTAYDPMYDHSIRQNCTFTKPSSVIKHGLLGDFPAMFDYKYQRVSQIFFVSSLSPFPLSLHFFLAFIGSYSPLIFKGRLELQPTSQILCSPNLIKPKPHQALLTSKGLSTLAKKLLFRQISYHHQILQARMVCRDLTNFDRSGQIFKRTAETG